MMEKSKLVFLDTETTNNNDEAEIVEVAYSVAGIKSQSLFKPKTKISIDAMSVNHITEKMVENAPAFEGGDMQAELKLLFDAGAILVAHNAEFDAGVLRRQGVDPKQVICTMKCARYLDKKDEITSYKMQYIRYLWGIESDAQSHNAGDDIEVLEKIYDKLAEKLSIDQMLQITREPFLLRKLTFGKHKGMPFKNIPRDYLLWMRRQDNIQGDLLYTINFYINKT